jgi:hypothetical protein
MPDDPGLIGSDQDYRRCIQWRTPIEWILALGVTICLRQLYYTPSPRVSTKPLSCHDTTSSRSARCDSALRDVNHTPL